MFIAATITLALALSAPALALPIRDVHRFHSRPHSHVGHHDHHHSARDLALLTRALAQQQEMSGAGGSMGQQQSFSGGAGGGMESQRQEISFGLGSMDQQLSSSSSSSQAVARAFNDIFARAMGQQQQMSGAGGSMGQQEMMGPDGMMMQQQDMFGGAGGGMQQQQGSGAGGMQQQQASSSSSSPSSSPAAKAARAFQFGEISKIPVNRNGGNGPMVPSAPHYTPASGSPFPADPAPSVTAGGFVPRNYDIFDRADDDSGALSTGWLKDVGEVLKKIGPSFFNATGNVVTAAINEHAASKQAAAAAASASAAAAAPSPSATPAQRREVVEGLIMRELITHVAHSLSELD
ncbi:hypothetical protein EUX98_g7074 [Antrodiella citrinella]|uniref:Uncharacterized protein n=1 Tax=Antrodiella citrinella TaxID=2447956 RepID=A0A4V3XHY0_9APHY|nr:hypothetical protein EUX98_g7074 [Antrodiella citrinella]